MGKLPNKKKNYYTENRQLIKIATSCLIFVWTTKLLIDEKFHAIMKLIEINSDAMHWSLMKHLLLNWRESFNMCGSMAKSSEKYQVLRLHFRFLFSFGISLISGDKAIFGGKKFLIHIIWDRNLKIFLKDVLIKL